MREYAFDVGSWRVMYDTERQWAFAGPIRGNTCSSRECRKFLFTCLLNYVSIVSRAIGQSSPKWMANGKVRAVFIKWQINIRGIFTCTGDGTEIFLRPERRAALSLSLSSLSPSKFQRAYARWRGLSQNFN